MKKLLLLFAIVWSGFQTLSAQCNPSGVFEYSFNNFVLFADANDTITDCPGAASISYSWSFNGITVGTTNYLFYTWNTPGAYELCLEVSFYDENENLLGQGFSCQEVLIPCFISFSPFVVNSTANELIVNVSQIFGGAPPYEINWSSNIGTNGTLTSTNNLVIPAPVYPMTLSFAVTDSNGCWQSATLSVQGPQANCDYYFTTSFNGNIVTIQEYLNGQPIGDDHPGYSYFLVSGTNVYSYEHNPTLMLPNTGTFNIQSYFSYQNCAEIPYNASVVITSLDQTCDAIIDFDQYGFSYQFFNASSGFYNATQWTVNGQVVSNWSSLYYNFEAGATYTVVMTISNSITGCTSATSMEIVTPEPVTICGYAFEDVNENGIMDDGEPGIQGVSIFEYSLPDSVFTDINGYYEIQVYPGDFVINASSNVGYAFIDAVELYWTSFEGNYLDYSSGCGVNFPMESSQAQICGVAFNDANQNGVYDSGETLLANVEVMNYANTQNFGSNVAYTNQDGEYCVTVQAGWAYIYAEYQTAEGSVLYEYVQVGQVLVDGSYTVNIPFYFIEDAIEVGVNLSAGSTVTPGFHTYFNVYLNNAGENEAIADIVVNVDPNLSIVSALDLNGVQAIINNTTHTITWPEVSIGGMEFLYAYYTTLTPTTFPLGNIVTSSVAAFVTNGDDVFLDNNQDAISQVCVGSYDPNNKLVYLEYGAEIGYNEGDQYAISTLPTNDYFTYVINFQNTGTAPAYTVRVEDVLDQDLDWSTFQMIGATHDYMVEMIQGKLIWTFNNIMLPDSTTDEPNSHGQIVFKIKPIAGMPVNSLFENTAYIYFDFNEAIITNTSTVLFVTTIGVNDSKEASQGISIYPNPAENRVNIVSGYWDETTMIRIYDMTGRLLFSERMVSPSMMIEPQLAKGHYMIEVISESNRRTSGLIIR